MNNLLIFANNSFSILAKIFYLDFCFGNISTCETYIGLVSCVRTDPNIYSFPSLFSFSYKF